MPKAYYLEFINSPEIEPAAKRRRFPFLEKRCQGGGEISKPVFGHLLNRYY